MVRLSKYFILLPFLAVTLACNSPKVIEHPNIKEEKKQKLLMIGNSFTFYWNLPQVLEMMFEHKGIKISVDQKTIGGSKLKEHWNYHINENYNLDSYDFVVFNDHSTYPLLETDTCAKYLKLFTELASLNKTKPFVYGTWEYPYLKDISKNRNSNTMFKLDSLASSFNATYVPAGNAISYAEENYPELDLYMDDQKHPSPNATYLIACVFYSMLTGDSPIGLPRRFEGKNIEDKKIYYIITETKAAETAQKIAEKITYLER